MREVPHVIKELKVDREPPDKGQADVEQIKGIEFDWVMEEVAQD